MSVDIRFVAWVVPTAKGRPQFARTRRGVRTITPDKTRRWEAEFAAIAQPHAPRELIDEPVFVAVKAVIPRPQKLMRKNAPEGLVPHVGKPDLDNIFKAVTDALEAFWRSDSRIACFFAEKWYAEKTGLPRVEVLIRSISPSSEIALSFDRLVNQPSAEVSP